MSKAQYYCAMSLDGYIAESDDTLEWLMGYQGSYDGDEAESGKGKAGYEGFYEGVGALVSGSVTYEFVLDHLDMAGAGGEWPYKGKPCWILTSRDLPVPDGEGVDVRMANARVPELYDELIAAAGDRNLWVIGGGNVASQFADAGLLDEVIVYIAPVTLGAGAPLLPRRLELRLEELHRNVDFAAARYSVARQPD
jgi:dihydrofolate reductase